MIIKLWDNFSKRRNSTKRPSGGVAKSVYLKEETSIERPSFILQEPMKEWTYVQAFNKYYFVTDVVNLDGSRCEIMCDQDVLATFRDEILSYSAFVERASAMYDVFLNDPLLSVKQKLLRDTQTLTSTDSFFTTGAGCFVTEVLAKDQGVVLYATSNLDAYKYILTPGVYTTQDKQDWIQSTIAQSFDLDVYIGHIKWMPFTASDIGSTIGNHFQIGPIDIAQSVISTGGSWTYTVYKVSQTMTKHKELTLSLPSTNNFNDFRDCNNQYTQYNLYLPGVGLVNLDASVIGYAINNGKDIYVMIDVDMVSGEITYQLRFKSGGGAGAFISRYSGNISVDVPIGKSAVDVTKSAKMIAGSVGAGAAAGGWIGAVGGALVGTVEAIYNSMTPDTSMIGGSGNKTEIFYNHSSISLGRRQFDAKDFPTNVAGRPLMQNVVLGNLSGYVKCGNASVPLNAHEGDMAEVNNYLNSGFYIE